MVTHLFGAYVVALAIEVPKVGFAARSFVLILLVSSAFAALFAFGQHLIGIEDYQDQDYNWYYPHGCQNNWTTTPTKLYTGRAASSCSIYTLLGA